MEKSNTKSKTRENELEINLAELEPEELFYIPIRIGNKVYEGLIDSGADMNMVNESIIQTLEKEINRGKPISFFGVGNKKCISIGKSYPDVMIGNTILEEVEFDVVKDSQLRSYY
mgnify:CR=1 FL=1